MEGDGKLRMHDAKSLSELPDPELLLVLVQKIQGVRELVAECERRGLSMGPLQLHNLPSLELSLVEEASGDVPVSVVDQVELELRELLVQGHVEDLSKASVGRLIERMKSSLKDADRCHEELSNRAERFLVERIGLSAGDGGKWLGKGTTFKVVDGGLEVGNVQFIQYGANSSGIYGKVLLDLFRDAGILFEEDREAGDIKFVIT